MRERRPTVAPWRQRERRLRRVSVTQDRSVSAGEDLARAFTLPASAYIDESVYRRERDRIFARTWQLVARADELSRVGDLKPATILDEPILITRGLDGKLRGFYNVCRHRAAQVVVEAAGDQDRLVEDGGRLQVTDAGQLIGTGNQLPGPRENPVLLARIDGFVDVRTGRQRESAGEILARAHRSILRYRHTTKSTRGERRRLQAARRRFLPQASPRCWRARVRSRRTRRRSR